MSQLRSIWGNRVRATVAFILAGCGATRTERVPAPITPEQTWRSTKVAGAGLWLRLPREYKPRNNFGCYSAGTIGAIPARGWRDMCIDVEDAGESRRAAMEVVDEATAAKTRCFDCVTYRQIRTDTVRLGDYAAIVQRGLASGGIEHGTNMPTMVIRLWLTPDSLAVFRCRVSGAHDQAEVLGIASTVRRSEP